MKTPQRQAARESVFLIAAHAPWGPCARRWTYELCLVGYADRKSVSIVSDWRGSYTCRTFLAFRRTRRHRTGDSTRTLSFLHPR